MSKNQSGAGKHQSVQKRRMKKLKDDVALAPPPSGQIPFHPSMMNYDLMSNMGHALASMGADMRADTASASLFGPLGATLPSSTASAALHSSLHGAASDMSNGLSAYLPYSSQADSLTGRRDFSGEAAAAAAAGVSYDLGSLYTSSSGGVQSGAIGLDGSDDPTLLQSLQRRRLLVGAAKKQQEAMDMLRQSSEMARLAQSPGVAPMQFSGGSVGDYSSFGDMAQQERMAVYNAGAPSIGSLMGLAGSMAAPGSAYDLGPFDPQNIMTSHLAAAASQYGSFFSPPSGGQMQLPRVAENSDNGYSQRAAGALDGTGRETLSKNERDHNQR